MGVMYRTLIRALAPRDEGAPAYGEHQPRNFVLGIAALVLSKLADALADAKVVLPSLLSAAGAPGAVIGALVPVREAGSLPPQIPVAARVARTRLRKRVWSAAAAVQGLGALGLAACALTLSGTAAGIGALACLAVMATARSAASVSHKDALARTVAKTRRGTVSGVAGTLGAAGGVAFGAALATGLLPSTAAVVGGAVALAGLLWLGAAAVFLGLRETPPDRDDDAPPPALGLAPLRDAQLRRFVATRALLTATALAPPHLVMQSWLERGDALGGVEPLVPASAAASVLSSYARGRLSDRSSRRTPALSAGLGAGTLAACAAAGAATGGLGGLWGAAAAMFALQLAYAGVRLARKTHLTDMAPDESRAGWTAVADTLIGAVLLAGPLLGWLAESAGAAWTLGLLALLCAVAAPAALTLEEEQSRA